MKNIIAICGKFGSGKSYVANYLSEQTDIQVFHMDKYIIEKLMRFPYRRIATKRLKMSPCLSHPHLLSNMKELDRLLTRFEKKVVLGWGNKKIKKLSKLRKPVIIDFFGLPLSQHFPTFKMRILIESNEDLRKEKLVERNEFTLQQVNQINKIADDIISYDKGKFDYVLENNYDSMPIKTEEIKEKLLAFYS